MLKSRAKSRLTLADSGHLILLFAVTVLVFIFVYPSELPRMAYEGYSSLGYVTHKLHPANFAKDWPNSILTYDHSLPMLVLLGSEKYLYIPAAQVLGPYIFLELFVLLHALYFLTNTLLRNQTCSTFAAIILFLSRVPVLNINRSSISGLLELPFELYYGYALAMVFYSLAFFLRSRYTTMFLFLLLTALAHFTWGLYTSVFVAAYLAVYPTELKPLLAKPWQLLLLVIAGIVLAWWAYGILSLGHEGEPIPRREWIRLSRIFSVHWHLITMGYFTHRAHVLVIPMLALVVSATLCVLVRRDAYDAGHIAKICCGCSAVAILTAVGVFFCDIIPLPTVVKLAPQRSSMLISLFAAILLIQYLYACFTTASLVKVALACVATVMLVASDPGLSLVPVSLLLALDITKTRLRWPWRLASAGLCMLPVILAVVSQMVKLVPLPWSPPQAVLSRFDVTRKFDLGIRGGKFVYQHGFAVLLLTIFVFVCVIFLLRRWTKTGRFERAQTAVLSAPAVLAVVLLSIHLVSRQVDWIYNKQNRYQAFLDAQLWARDNTPPGSLFIKDPGGSYGWRDFSQRAFFGNYREWGHISICYIAKRTTYEAGLQRFRDFGVELNSEPYLTVRQPGKLRKRIATTIHDRFYRLSEEDLIALSNKYDIDYVVLEKQHQRLAYPALATVFENHRFKILKLP